MKSSHFQSQTTFLDLDADALIKLGLLYRRGYQTILIWLNRTVEAYGV